MSFRACRPMVSATAGRQHVGADSVRIFQRISLGWEIMEYPHYTISQVTLTDVNRERPMLTQIGSS